MRSVVSLAPLVGSILSTKVYAAATAAASKNNAAIVPGAYLVELEDNEDASSFYGNLSAQDIQVSSRLNLTYTLYKGSSFQLHDLAREDETINTISAFSCVRKVSAIKTYSLPNDRKISVGGRSASSSSSSSTFRKRQSDDNDTFSTHVMTQVDQLRALGYTGSGIRIGIIDTGVDYLHPALGGCFGSGCLVEYGYDLAGDNYTGYNTPVPDDDPYDDCQGHGSHVAGIIAAQPNEYNFTGAAPDVTLGMYRVFGCSGSAADDILISAYNMAYEAGSDIITASIGGDNGWSEEPWAVAVQRIVEQGVPCTVAAGNDGDAGLFFSSTAANGKLVASVASFDNWEYPALLYAGTYTTSTSSAANSSAMEFGWTPSSPPFGNVSLPLYATSNDTTNDADACDALPSDTPDLTDYIVLIRRGTCTFVAKAENAAAYGARYIMFYGNTGALVETDLTSVSQIIGAGMVSATQGGEWVDDLNAGEQVLLNIIDPDYAGETFESGVNDVTGGFASTYTSWGPTWELDVYPDVAAPGGNIFSTYPLSQGGYAVLSGTSMATPLAAAIYALVGQVRGTFDPTILGNYITTTAKANLWNDGDATYGSLAPVPQQGPGMIQAYDAAYATTSFSVASISFNDTDHLVDSYTFGIENTGSASVTYTVGHVAALTVYTLDEDGDLYPAAFPNPSTDVAATLSFSESTIDIAAGASGNITVSPTPPAGLDESRLPVYSGYITINGTNGENYTIPYLGLAGSLYSATNLDPTYTYLTSYADASYSASAANGTFTVPEPTLDAAEDPDSSVGYPSAYYQLDLGAAVVRIDVVPLAADYAGNTSTVLGTTIAGSVYGYPTTYVDRGAYVEPFTGLLADGSVVPAGQYQLVVKTLRIFGDADSAADYMTETLVPFTLAYE